MKEADLHVIITPANKKIIKYVADAPVKKLKFRMIDKSRLTPRKLVY